jgi:ParB family transcriptional regulator, chromosome partitioning protein
MSKFPKPRLGRGLSSLIAVSDLPVEREFAASAASAATVEDPIASRLSSMQAIMPPLEADRPQARESVLELPIGAIVVNPHQPRRTMNEAALAELASSLKGTGLIQPVVVRKAGEQYELIAGERRWRAAQLAGFATIPVVVKEVDAFVQAQMALVENIQRENLNPIDRALAYRSLVSQLGLTQAELAQRLGEERSTIANYLRLLDLSDVVQQMIVDGRLSLGHGKLLASMPDILEQQRLAQVVIAQELSVRNLERLIQEAKSSLPSAAPKPSASAHLVDLEKALSRQLGLRIQIRTSGRSSTKGRLICHYANLDQFDELLARLNVTTE